MEVLTFFLPLVVMGEKAEEAVGVEADGCCAEVVAGGEEAFVEEAGVLKAEVET